MFIIPQWQVFGDGTYYHQSSAELSVRDNEAELWSLFIDQGLLSHRFAMGMESLNGGPTTLPQSSLGEDCANLIPSL